MIDFHTHILPGIDDGSKNPEMTEGMLLEEASQGADIVVATPHFYADRVSIPHFLARREQAVAKTRERMKQLRETTTLPRIITGAEVYYFQGMGSARELPSLCVQNTDVLLLELPFEQWNSQVLQDVKDLIRKRKLTLVLAHIERYNEFQKDRSVWDEILSLPVIPQINAGSFLKHGGLFRRDPRRKFSLKFLEEHPRTILGSDAHNLTTRKPNMKDAMDAIAAAAGTEVLERMDEAAREVLGR